MLFIDELHTLVGAGAAEGAVDAANILKPSLARGELQMHRRHHARRVPQVHRARRRARAPLPAGAWSRSRPSRRRSRSSRASRSATRQHHRLEITDEAIKAAAELASRYVPDRFMPDKAIDLVDEASSRVRMQRASAPPVLKEVDARARERPERRRTARSPPSSTSWPPSTATARPTAARAKSTTSSRAGSRAAPRGQRTVDAEDIAQVVAMWTGIPVMRIAEEESSAPAQDGGRAPRARHRPGRGDPDRSPRPSAAPAPA